MFFGGSACLALWLVQAVGGSRDASESLRDFLGRDPTPDAFLRSKGLAASAAKEDGDWDVSLKSHRSFYSC